MVAQKGVRKSKACRAAKKTSKKARKTPESNKPMRLTFSYDGNDVFKDIGTYEWVLEPTDMTRLTISLLHGLMQSSHS